MRVSNKKKVIIYNYTIMYMIFVMLLIIGLKDILAEIFAIQFINVYSSVIMGIATVYCLFILVTKNKIIEYDTSIDKLSIRTYPWYKNINKSLGKTYIIPQKNLIHYNIEQVFLCKFLNIILINEIGKNKKICIDITSLSQNEANKLHVELEIFLLTKKYSKENQNL